MAQNRWQIAVGAVVLMLALLAGAFSLGVYVGRYGLTAQGLRLQPSDAIRPGGNLQPAQGDEPALIGRLVQIRQDGLDLVTQQGRRFVSTTPQTQWIDPQGQPLEPESLQEGDMLAIFGRLADGGNQWVADRIVRLPQQPQ